MIEKFLQKALEAEAEGRLEDSVIWMVCAERALALAIRAEAMRKKHEEGSSDKAAVGAK